MISLVVPIYNVKPYIEEFLESVEKQTFDDYEAILVDDGSNDGTEAILDRYATRNPKFKVIHKANGGVVSAWKRGIEEARGEYVAFADPDDILSPEMLEVQNRLMTEYDADIVMNGITRWEADSFTPQPVEMRNLAEGLYADEQLEEIKRDLFGSPANRENAIMFFRCNKVFKKKLLLQNIDYGKDGISFGDDVCITASAVYDCNRLYYTHKSLYIYRIRNESLTTATFKREQIENAERVLSSVFAMLKDKGRYTSFIDSNYTAYHICYLIKKIAASNLSPAEKRSQLRYLRNRPFVETYSLREAKKRVSRNRYLAIRLLKSPLYRMLCGSMIKGRLS